MIRRALSIVMIFCGVLLAAWAAYQVAFQVWLSATPNASGDEQAAALRATALGVVGVAIVGAGVVLALKGRRKP
ncbi:MAG: hypothetical protein IT434_15420 [Phycisphaerales bacterium]|nr:hypothetical protein [Phycisphaerales bacterium]